MTSLEPPWFVSCAVIGRSVCFDILNSEVPKLHISFTCTSLRSTSHLLLSVNLFFALSGFSGCWTCARTHTKIGSLTSYLYLDVPPQERSHVTTTTILLAPTQGPDCPAGDSDWEAETGGQTHHLLHRHPYGEYRMPHTSTLTVLTVQAGLSLPHSWHKNNIQTG